MSPDNTRSQTPMPKVTAHLSISLDGYVAGPHQTPDEPLGVLGEELHLWHLGQIDNDVDRAMTARLLAPRGAYVMGRNMYAPDRGDWADAAAGEMWPGGGGGVGAGRGGGAPAVPRAGLRAHPLPARPGRDGGRHHLPLRHQLRRGDGARARGGG